MYRRVKMADLSEICCWNKILYIISFNYLWRLYITTLHMPTLFKDLALNIAIYVQSAGLQMIEEEYCWNHNTNLWKIKPKCIQASKYILGIKQACINCNAFYFNSWCPGFEFKSGQILSWLSSFVFFSSDITGKCLEVCHDQFLPHLFQFSIHCLL